MNNGTMIYTALSDKKDEKKERGIKLIVEKA